MNYKLENAESYTNKTILYIHGWNSKLETMEVLSCCNDKYNLLFIDYLDVAKQMNLKLL